MLHLYFKYLKNRADYYTVLFDPCVLPDSVHDNDRLSLTAPTFLIDMKLLYIRPPFLGVYVTVSLYVIRGFIRFIAICSAPYLSSKYLPRASSCLQVASYRPEADCVAYFLNMYQEDLLHLFNY